MAEDLQIIEVIIIEHNFGFVFVFGLNSLKNNMVARYRLLLYTAQCAVCSVCFPSNRTKNMIPEETMTFKLQICDFRVILTDLECSKNDVSSAGK